MKNILLVSTFLLVFISCSEDNVTPTPIYGSILGGWFIENDYSNNPEQIMRNELVFNGDGTFEDLKILIDVDSDSIIDVSAYKGRYFLEGDLLKRVEVSSYFLEKDKKYNDFGDLTLLEESFYDHLEKVRFNVENEGNTLTIDYSINGCDGTASCIGPETYERKIEKVLACFVY